MNQAEIEKAGILKKEETLRDQLECSYKTIVKTSPDDKGTPWSVKGTLLVTNKRLVFVKKPGMFSKGLDVMVACSLGNILSVSSGGMIFKQIVITLENVDNWNKLEFLCSKPDVFANKLVEYKNEFVEEKRIEAKTIIIEEAEKQKESAEEILKKRLAKGEIELDEFHKKVQRT